MAVPLIILWSMGFLSIIMLDVWIHNNQILRTDLTVNGGHVDHYGSVCLEEFIENLTRSCNIPGNVTYTLLLCKKNLKTQN